MEGRDGHDRSNHKGMRDEGSVGSVGDARVVECMGVMIIGTPKISDNSINGPARKHNRKISLKVKNNGCRDAKWTARLNNSQTNHVKR